jgi:hypothetical protein
MNPESLGSGEMSRSIVPSGWCHPVEFLSHSANSRADRGGDMSGRRPQEADLFVNLGRQCAVARQMDIPTDADDHGVDGRLISALGIVE